MIARKRITGFAALLLATGMAGCHRGEQAVVGAAKSAVTAEQKAQAAAAERDQQRAAFGKIPLPTKSMYVDVHDPSAWVNPFISVEAETLDLRIILADANPSTLGEGTMLRPPGARREEMVIRPEDLMKALLALPTTAWPYGRVVAVAETPQAQPKDRPAIRRNVEAVIQELNDAGIVVEEWPSR